MSAGWKPGDVALLDSWRGKGQLAFRCERIKDDPTWCVSDGHDSRGLTDEDVTDARSVAVIDPEDREQVERLVKALHKTPWFGEVNIPTHTSLLINALREFANPTPPRPDEPLGLGAVVEDDKGHKFVRVADPIDGWMAGRQWQRIGGEVNAVRNFGWSAIAAVRILSEGITP